MHTLTQTLSRLSTVPRSLRVLTSISSCNAHSRTHLSLPKSTLSKTPFNVFVSSLSRPLSSSTFIEFPSAKLAKDAENSANEDPNLEKLKELAFAVVKRSPTRHFSQAQFEKAQELVESYYQCDPEERFRFLLFLSTDFSTSQSAANLAAAAYLETQSRDEPYDAALLVDRLRGQIRPRHQELFRHISRLDAGVKFLVDLRGDLITVLGNAQLLCTQLDPSAKVTLRLMSSELSELLSLWFSAGFLRLERVTWDSPTSTLQKISEYEAVHPVRNWLDLKNRVGLYRRCYMFSHSCLPGEPLVILHVALVPEISSSIQEIILKTSPTPSSSTFRRSAASVPETAQHELKLSASKSLSKLFNASSFARFTSTHSEDESRMKAAVFYSISSTQKGLNGIDLGHAMIQQVAGELKSDFTRMKLFSSLSPIPNFTEYLLSTIQAIQREDQGSDYLKFWQKCANLPKLRRYVEGNERFATQSEARETPAFWSRISNLLRTGVWIDDPVLVEHLKEPLMSICAHYLHNEKRRGYALNSVANFHLKNGAVMWRLNWLADSSPRGLVNSCGLMVNYRYFLENAEENSQTYLMEKRIIAGEEFSRWL